MLTKTIITSLVLLVVTLAFSLTCEMRLGLGNFRACLANPIAMISDSAAPTQPTPTTPPQPTAPTTPDSPQQQAGLCYRPCEPQKQAVSNQRPACLKWHKVRRGETQWKLADHYAGRTNKWLWIKSMRWVSRKSVGDSLLKSGESVCVNWRRSA